MLYRKDSLAMLALAGSTWSMASQPMDTAPDKIGDQMCPPPLESMYKAACTVNTMGKATDAMMCAAGCAVAQDKCDGQQTCSGADIVACIDYAVCAVLNAGMVGGGGDPEPDCPPPLESMYKAACAVNTMGKATDAMMCAAGCAVAQDKCDGQQTCSGADIVACIDYAVCAVLGMGTTKGGGADPEPDCSLAEGICEMPPISACVNVGCITTALEEGGEVNQAYVLKAINKIPLGDAAKLAVFLQDPDTLALMKQVACDATMGPQFASSLSSVVAPELLPELAKMVAGFGC